MPNRRDVLKSLAATTALPATAQTAPLAKIRHLDIIHHSHTDVGYTDIPSVTRELQVRFLSAALEACLRNPSFRWTAEVTLTVDDWWRGASDTSRAQLVKVVQAGQMDVMAMPFNQAPFMDAMQWDTALGWLPADVQELLRPRIAMQNDVNGCPRAGAIHFLNRGIRHLLMGINSDSGGPPFRRPSAFWWRMPDGRKLFVWLGDHYGTAYAFFESTRWQHGQAKGATTTLRPPYAGDHLNTGEASLRAAQQQLHKRLAKLESDGYSHSRLILSYTNQWRYDNDPPFPPLAPFIDAWNKLGLQPTLRLATATQAVQDMETAVANEIPTYEGEWTDWWANGDASGPREVAASRLAKRHIHAALANVFGAPSSSVLRRSHEILKDLCLFDEHTWGANVSVSQPDSLDTHAQYCEKSILAYRPMGHAEFLLGQRARALCLQKPEGNYVINTASEAYTGWVKFPGLDTKPVWVNALPPSSVQRLDSAQQPPLTRITLQTDAQGWPDTAQWTGMQKPLFTPGFGNFLCASFPPPATRSTIARIHSSPDPAEREKLRKEGLRLLPATYGSTKMEETPYTFVFTQDILHPRLDRASRRLELFRGQPRARLTVSFQRISSLVPEVLYLLTPLPTGATLPRFSNGGMPFTPYTDQIPGSCRDYYAIDSWAHYQTNDGEWLWVTRDAPLVAVGGPHPVARHTEAPPDPNRLWAMVFDNCWHTNFVADSHGGLEFNFDLEWRPKFDNPDAAAEALSTDPVVVTQGKFPVSPEFVNTLFLP
jgi:hypothetical protein